MEASESFADMRLNGIPLSECELVLETAGDYRLYLHRLPNDLAGFIAKAVQLVSYTSDGDPWLCPDLFVEELFTVTALFDGVRHLEFNRDSGAPGYIYYPNMTGLCQLFNKVRELQESICDEWD